MHILSLAGVFPTTPANIVGTTPANDRMGYAQTNVSPWPDTPIGGLLAYNFKVKICAAERYNQINKHEPLI